MAGIGRITGVDPIADQFPHVTVYNYAENRVPGGIDLWGLQFAPPPLPGLPEGTPPRFHDRAKSINRPSYNQPTIGPNQFKSRKQPERILDNRSSGEKVGAKISLFGDVLATTGYVFAPFTLGQSFIISPFGEAISMGGKAIEHYYKFEENGPTRENYIDLGVDLSVELIPAPLEHAVKKSSLGKVSKHILRSEIGKVKQVSGYGINEKINENRSDNESTDEN